MRVPSVAGYLALFVLSAFFAICVAARQDADGDRIRVVPNEATNRADITIDGKPFTSYIWPEKLAKPVLYPLRTAKGTVVTRGYPLEPRSGERVDHPHHVGLWFNYGNVNDIDFWNNSDAIKPENAPKMGVIRHRSIVSAKSGADQGELEVEADWLTYDKEGLLGMRVTRALEAPSDKPEVFTDSSGHATTVAKLDNAGVNGTYLTSEAKRGDAAWGTRARWCNLSGRVGDEPVTITILDHPSNPGFPTFWHARGYGLFAANPLGKKIFTNGKEEMNFSLAPGESVTFRYRILISSEIATPEATEAAYKAFIAAYH